MVLLLTKQKISRSLREEPGHEVHGGDRHADAKEYAGEYELRTALAESAREARYDNRDKRKSAGDGAREGLLQDTHSVFPGGGGSALSEERSGDNKADA